MTVVYLSPGESHMSPLIAGRAIKTKQKEKKRFAVNVTLYLQLKAIEQLEELRDSSEVQTLMGQQKLVYHHIHVVLWDIRKKTRGRRLTITWAKVKYILHVE